MISEKEILKLRLQVLSLGEKHQWWNSFFFSDESASFLEYVFPKTLHSTAIIAASEVAKEVHDSAIGIGRFHLFRLPQGVEERIYRLVLNRAESKDVIKTSQNNQLAILEKMTDYIAINNQQGAVYIGTLKEDNIISVWSKHYFEAFENDYQTFPYLTY